MTGPIPFSAIAVFIADALGTLWSLDKPIAEIAPDSELTADLGFDSLHRQQLAVELDEAFGIEVPDDDIAEWRTAEDVHTTVLRLTRSREGACHA